MKKIVLAFCVAVITNFAFAQKVDRIGRFLHDEKINTNYEGSSEYQGTYSYGYVKTDSAYYSGWIVIKEIKGFDIVLHLKLQGKVYRVVNDDMVEFGIYETNESLTSGRQRANYSSGKDLELKYVKKNFKVNGIERSGFLKEIYNGKTNMYVLIDNTKSTYYIEKNDELISFERIKKLNGEKVNYTDQLTDIFGDSPYINEYLENARYNEFYFKSLLYNYDNNLKYRIHTWHYGVQAGVAQTNIGYTIKAITSGIAAAEFKNTNFYKAGVTLKYPITRNNMLLARTGLQLNTGSFEGRNNGTDMYQYLDYKASIAFVEIPLGLELNFLPRQSFCPYVLADFIIGATTYFSSEITGLTVDVDPVNSYIMASDVKKIQPSIALGAGVKFKVGKTAYMYAEYIYQNSAFDFPQITQNGVNLGFCFKY